MAKSKKILLVQLGSPKSLRTKDMRSYLREFLGDPRVVDLNPVLWKIILNLFILPFRPAKIAEAYKNIWDGKEFELIKNTRVLCEKMNNQISDYEVDVVYLLSEPRIDQYLHELENSGELFDIDLTIIPLFPQYSEATSASVFDMASKALVDRAYIPSFKFVNNFHRSKAFIENGARKINEFLESRPHIDHLVISFHGIPKRRALFKNDPYYQHCLETYELLAQRVSFEKVSIAFQSRFGSEEWLGPYADLFIIDLVKKGEKNVAVYCPSFIVDCLETTVEIGIELDEEVEEFGGKVYQIPCLNDDEKWIKDFSEYAKIQAQFGSEKTAEQECQLTNMKAIEDQMKQEASESAQPLTKEAKSTIKIVFLTLFLDLVGFSIIFPLFPALAKHYLLVDSQNYFLKLIFDSINLWANQGGQLSMNSIVLFGGALGALYSLLQFVAAPIWGSISDKIGRKPVLLISVFFLGVSYLLWAISGSFTLLIFSRFIGGIMGGNISTATAVIADVTSSKNRSKGMAFVGIAFAFGFIIGPAMGGLLSLIDLTKLYPNLVQYGINPFSMPALLAGALSFINLYFLIKNFKETLPPEKRGKGELSRSSNPLKLFKPLPYPGVNLTNFSHFLFLLAFSGMEFTLTFLAVERLNFSSMDNAYMFIFIGFIIALVQGGVVRRKASQVGEKKMSLIGLITILPGLALIGYTNSVGLLYLGLFFLAAGSSMAIPCLTSLVSLYTPSQEQGRSIGIFRSLGALSRVIGPIVASIVYWKFGSSFPYVLGIIVLIIPILMILKLPKPNYN